MNKSVILALLSISLLLAALPAQALLPNVDPSKPTRWVYKRGEYRGSKVALPPASSSGARVSVSSRLGETFPTTVLTPKFSGRIVGKIGFAPQGGSAIRSAVRESALTPSRPKTNKVSGPKTIAGKPDGFVQRTYTARWAGTAAST